MTIDATFLRRCIGAPERTPDGVPARGAGSTASRVCGSSMRRNGICASFSSKNDAQTVLSLIHETQRGDIGGRGRRAGQGHRRKSDDAGVPEWRSMSNTDETRWRQRLENFGAALAQLDEACERTSYTNLERAGLIKTFELCFELSWNVLKDLLFYEGYDEKVPRSAIRRSFEVEYIDERDCEVLLEALDRRNVLTRVYRRSAALDAEKLIKERYHPALRRLHDALSDRARR